MSGGHAQEIRGKLTQRGHPDSTRGMQTRHHFLPHLKDENMNRGATDEPKITWDRHSILMTIQMSVTRLSHPLMMKSNGQSNNNKRTVHFRVPIDDTLAVANKC